MLFPVILSFLAMAEESPNPPGIVAPEVVVEAEEDDVPAVELYIRQGFLRKLSFTYPTRVGEYQAIGTTLVKIERVEIVDGRWNASIVYVDTIPPWSDIRAIEHEIRTGKRDFLLFRYDVVPGQNVVVGDLLLRVTRVERSGAGPKSIYFTYVRDLD